MKSSRKIYQDANGEIPEGYEVHHIIPKHSTGSDEVDNLIALSREDHRQAHLDLFRKSGDFRDLAAYHMIGYNFSEAHRITSSAGGKIGGKVTKVQNKGIFRSEEERKKWSSAGGQAAQQTLRENKSCAFYNPELRAESSRKGGKASPSFKDQDAQRRRGQKGGVKNAGTVWVNDGITAFKFRPSEAIGIKEFLSQNPKVSLGRIKRNKK